MNVFEDVAVQFVPVNPTHVVDQLEFLFESLTIKKEFEKVYPSLVDKKRITNNDFRGLYSLPQLSECEFQTYSDIKIKDQEEISQIPSFAYEIKDFPGLEIHGQIHGPITMYSMGLVIQVLPDGDYEIDLNLEKIVKVNQKIKDWISEGRLPGPMKLTMIKTRYS